MPKQNAPGRKAEGALNHCGGDESAYSTAQARVQYLAGRLSLPIHRAALIAPMAFGVVDHA